MDTQMVSAAQMKQIDQHTIEEIGIPSLVLMERAALGVAEHILRMTDRTERILAVCGTGNNGADGIAAGRMLFLKGRPAEVLLVGDEESASQETKQQLRIARNCGMAIMTDWKEVDWPAYQVIVDALFGIGLNREVEQPHRSIIEAVNRLKEGRVVAVDIASGLDGTTGETLGTAIEADVTVTFGWEKTGMHSANGRAVSGIVEVVDIGYPDFVWNKFVKQ